MVIPLTVNKIASSGGFVPLKPSFPLKRSPLKRSLTVSKESCQSKTTGGQVFKLSPVDFPFIVLSNLRRGFSMQIFVIRAIKVPIKFVVFIKHYRIETPDFKLRVLASTQSKLNAWRHLDKKEPPKQPSNFRQYLYDIPLE